MLNKKFKTALSALFVVTLIAGCSSSNNLSEQEIEVKTKLFNSTGNYNGLVDLYRGLLKSDKDNSRPENPEYRYRLAEAYYNLGDYSACVLYLQPLLSLSEYNQKALLLQMKALTKAGEFKKALIVANRLIQRYPNLAEAYNGQGIAYANLWELAKAKQSFEKSRALFINDVTALNNLAVIYIMQKNYPATIKLLLPAYNNGEKDTQLVHNLVLALVKTNKFDYARQIIENENLAEDPDSLIQSLTLASNQIMPIPKKPMANLHNSRVIDDTNINSNTNSINNIGMNSSANSSRNMNNSNGNNSNVRPVAYSPASSYYQNHKQVSRNNMGNQRKVSKPIVRSVPIVESKSSKSSR